MKICCLSPLIPSGAYGRRCYAFLKCLAQEGHDLTLHCIADPGPCQHAQTDLEALGIAVRPVAMPRWRRWLNCLSGWFGDDPLRILHCQCPELAVQFLGDLRHGGYDLLHVDRFRMAPYAIQAAEFFNKPVFIDYPDALSLYYSRAVEIKRSRSHQGAARAMACLAGIPKAVIGRHENLRIPAYENFLLKQPLGHIVCSVVDREHLLKANPQAEVNVLPHAMETDLFTPRQRGDGLTRGVFTGTLYYQPNIDGLLWLRNEVLPLLQDSAIEIDVFGYGATRELNAARQDPRFHFAGYVDRMSDCLFTDDIYLCPIRIAAGVRFKLLEAFAAGMAVISTSIGYEGIDCIPGEHLLVADSPKAFARAIDHLLEHPAERLRLGANARRFAVEFFSENAFRDNLNRLYGT